MYYLFEFTIAEGKSENTYGPSKCHGSIDPSKSYNAYLIDRLNNIGNVHKYQHPTDNWKTVHINMSHVNVIHGGNYEKLKDLVKQWERNLKIENLMNENI